MTSKCNGEIKLKWSDGQEIGCRYSRTDSSRKCFPVILETLDGNEVAIYPTSSYHFESDGQFQKFDIKYMSFFPTNPYRDYFLKVEKNNQDELNLSVWIKDSEGMDRYRIKVEECDIKKIGKIDLKKYANTEEPQIFIRQEEGSKVAYLYDIHDNKIGSLTNSTIAMHYTSDNKNDYAHSYDYYPNGGISTGFHTQDLPDGEISIRKVDGKYQIHTGEGNHGHKAFVEGLEGIIINYDKLDKIMEKQNPYCQIEALCKELDTTSMALSGTNHPCASNISSYSALIYDDQTAYDASAYQLIA